MAHPGTTTDVGYHFICDDHRLSLCVIKAEDTFTLNANPARLSSTRLGALPMTTTTIANPSEMTRCDQDVAETQQYFDSPRFEGIVRLYSARQVVEQRGTIP